MVDRVSNAKTFNTFLYKTLLPIKINNFDSSGVKNHLVVKLFIGKKFVLLWYKITIDIII